MSETSRWKNICGRASLIALFFAAGWFAGYFAFDHFAAIVYYCYAGGLVLCAGYSVLLHRIRRSDYEIDRRIAEKAGNPIAAHGTGRVGDELSEISRILCWPVILLREYRKRKRAQIPGWKRGGEGLLDLAEFPIFRCCFAAAIFLLTDSRSWQVLVLASAFALASACNLLGVALSPSKLLLRLRRTVGTPAIKLAYLLALDTVTFTIALAAISGHIAAGHGEVRTLGSGLMRILTAPKQMFEMPGQRLAASLGRLAPIDAFREIFGVLVYAALIRVIGSRGFTGLKRTDEDRQVLAMALAARGKSKKALAMLQDAEKPTYAIMQARCLALLQDGRISSAKVAASEMLMRDPNVHGDATPDDIYFELFDMWDVLSPEAGRKLLESADEAGLSNSVRFAIRVRLQFAASEDANEMPEVALQDAYSEAVRMHRHGEKERALRLLKSLDPANHADEFLKLLYSYFLASPSTELAAKRSAYIRSWVQENRGQLTRICSAMVHEQMWSNWIAQFMILEMCGAIHALDADTGSWLTQILSQQIEAMRSKRSGTMGSYVNARAVDTPFTNGGLDDRAYFLDAG